MAKSVKEPYMRFGLLMANQHPPSTSVAARFAEAIEQVRLARDVGFDMVALGQHFLSTEFQTPIFAGQNRLTFSTATPSVFRGSCSFL
jgi:hypothetical protein